LAQRPTAVFAATDAIAFGAMKVAQEAGLNIPRDLSIVGLDDYEKASLSSPALTTVRQPFHEIGKQAVQLLETMIKNRSAKPQHLLIKPELIIRDSTARPPKK
jgi:DNA-binding LacI/PurR family transcriptional regulator